MNTFVTVPNANTSSRSVGRWTDLFETLASPRRRTILATLQREGSATVSELATEIAKTERSGKSGGVPRGYHEAVVASLSHTHLPKLVDHDFVTWDQDSDVVAPTETCHRLDLFFVSLEATVGSADGHEPVA